MQLIQAPREALATAEACLAAMKSSSAQDELAEQWLLLLHALQRCWNKAEAGYGRSPKWHPLHSKFAAARKNDPTLTYLLHARNADEHGIAAITEAKDGWFGFSGNGYIREVMINKGHLYLDADPGITVTFEPGKVMALAVVDRGRSYEPPTHASVVSLAERGVAFYRAMLDEIEAKLVTSGKAPDPKVGG